MNKACDLMCSYQACTQDGFSITDSTLGANSCHSFCNTPLYTQHRGAEACPPICKKSKEPGAVAVTYLYVWPIHSHVNGSIRLLTYLPDFFTSIELS